MKIKLLIFFVSLFIFSCGNSQRTGNDWGKFFNKNNTHGTFVLYNLKSKQYKIFNKARSETFYIPASTFKILNSLIALETKVIKNENEIIKWDGIDRGWSEWNKDQNMKSAIGVSCVWFYQELARKIGTARMRKWINKVKYGNQLMGGKVDNFWLEGDLKISAMEQINFLDRLVNNLLPFRQRNISIVKKIMITDSTSNYIIHSKSGWETKTNPQIGWLVGYVEKEQNIWIFAMNMDIGKKTDLKLRKIITYEILKSEKIIVTIS